MADDKKKDDKKEEKEIVKDIGIGMFFFLIIGLPALLWWMRDEAFDWKTIQGLFIQPSEPYGTGESFGPQFKDNVAGEGEYNYSDQTTSTTDIPVINVSTDGNIAY